MGEAAGRQVTPDPRMGKLAGLELRALAVEVDPEEEARLVKAESYGIPISRGSTAGP